MRPTTGSPARLATREVLASRSASFDQVAHAICPASQCGARTSPPRPPKGPRAERSDVKARRQPEESAPRESRYMPPTWRLRTARLRLSGPPERVGVSNPHPILRAAIKSRASRSESCRIPLGDASPSILTVQFSDASLSHSPIEREVEANALSAQSRHGLRHVLGIARVPSTLRPVSHASGEPSPGLGAPLMTPTAMTQMPSRSSIAWPGSSHCSGISRV